MTEPLRARLDEAAAPPRVPVDHGRPQLYHVALAALVRLAHETGVSRFRTDELRRVLAEAAAAFPPGGGDFGPQPDPGDVDAFLANLQEDELVARGPAGWVLNLDAAPF